MSLKTSIASVVVGLLMAGAVTAAEPCVSGLPPGLRPGPYSFILATGANRGQANCYICETGEKPAMLVFARTPSDGLGKLVQGLDKALVTHKPADLRGWVTFLSDDQTALDSEVVKWGRKHGVRDVPLGVFEDVNGPPAYKLAKDADVTVLLFVKAKVVANFAFRSGELTEERVTEVMKALPQIVGDK